MKNPVLIAMWAGVALLLLTALNRAWLMTGVSAVGLVLVLLAGPRDQRCNSAIVAGTACVVAIAVALLFGLQ